MADKARIEKCPCGVCGMWELRRPNGSIFSKYTSHRLAVKGLKKLIIAVEASRVARIHRQRRTG